MTQQAELLQKVETLPPKYLGEVIDFAGYLQQKARQETVSAGNTQVIASDKWINPLLGLGKTIGASLTLDRFMELQQEEIEREDENDQRLWGNK